MVDLNETFGLKGRVAVVTGAASGIGAAGARALAQQGAHVVVTDRDGAGAQAVADSIGSLAEAKELDVTDDDAVRLAVDAAAERYGRLDILHSHAGIQIEGDHNRAYVKLLEVDNTQNRHKARIELDVLSRDGRVRRKVRTIRCGDDLTKIAGGREIYEGFVVDDICRLLLSS